jgi:phage protein D
MFSAAKTSDQMVPSLRVYVNGRSLPQQAVSDLLSASVLEDVTAPSMFTLTLVNWDMDRLRVTWADRDLFAEGNEVEVQMGYVDAYETLLVGEITGLEPAFVARDVPKLVVRGYDRRHRLMRDRRTRTFTQVKDSDIASQLASAAGLKADTTDSTVILAYVIQHNQTDLEFLSQRARHIGYDMRVDDKTLIFRPYRNTDTTQITLTRTQDLLEFYPRLSTMAQASHIQLRSWNPLDKALFNGQAKAGAEGTTMGGKTTGPSALQASLGNAAANTVIDRPVLSQAEADQIAQAQLQRRALSYITGEGVTVGRTDLRAGTVVGIEGIGRRFSGLYYLPSVEHTYSARVGYRTHFTVRRNAT